MLKETFYLDGVNADSVGIQLQNAMEFSEPVPIVERQSVPGKNGDLIFDTGSFENRTGTANCFALRESCVERSIRSINRFLLGTANRAKYRKLKTSDDPEHYWLARVENGARIEQRLRTLAPFELSFDCKPQRFLEEGNTVIEATNGGIIYNKYGFSALPFITVYGTGIGTLTISSSRTDSTVKFWRLDRMAYIDSEIQNALLIYGYEDPMIQTDKFPVLGDGENYISWDGGIERVEIEPRWWEL